jgi:hypothetical protein
LRLLLFVADALIRLVLGAHGDSPPSSWISRQRTLLEANVQALAAVDRLAFPRSPNRGVTRCNVAARGAA